MAKYSEEKKVRVNNVVHNEGLILEGEIKDSIAGRKSEPTSVDTGQFLNSVTTNNSEEFVSVVGSNVEHALYLEKGTTRITARKHFEMSELRRKGEIVKKIKEAIS